MNGPRSIAEWFARNNYNQTPDWEGLAHNTALAECRSRGYSRARNAVSIAATEDWRYTPDRSGDNDPQTWLFAAYKIRQYTATCRKTVRGPRR